MMIPNVPAADARSFRQLPNGEFRKSFLLEGLFVPRQVMLRRWETDRTLVGGAMPVEEAIALPADHDGSSLLARRELGVINIGGPGTVTVDGVAHALGRLDGLYVGRGAGSLAFASASAAHPAAFYLLSYPAHAAYPTVRLPHGAIEGAALGSPTSANERQLFKVIHPGAVQSCQLVMGITILRPGSVWNTLPPHVHLRRSEVYLYFDVPSHAAVFHFLGAPEDIRPITVRDRQAVLSPPWSIHCGVGTANYAFIWGMGGENQDFDDIDPVRLGELF